MSLDATTGTSGINKSFASNKFFTAEQSQLSVFGLDNLAKPYTKLKPRGSGIVDVVNSMHWKNIGSTEEVPYVWVTERELKYGIWTANLLQFLEQGTNFFQGLAGDKSVDTYLQLYASEKTGFSYNFPFLLKNGDNIRNVSNEWSKASGLGDMFKGMAGSGTGSTGVLSNLAGAAFGAGIGAITPGFGFEETYQYANTNLNELTVTFPLYNTISLESAFDHYTFVQLFTFQNLKTRTSLMTYIPPKIYTVDTFSKGGVYMAAAFVSNFKVDSIGTTRRMKDFSGFGPSEILIPEAYKISITFRDLVSQSSNIFSGSIGGSKIEVTEAGRVPEWVANAAEQGVGMIKSAGSVAVESVQGIFNGGQPPPPTQ
jgi:hypothetical protein